MTGCCPCRKLGRTKLWLTAHPTYKKASQVFLSLSSTKLEMLGTLCRLPVCAPCRYTCGMCAGSKEPRNINESWLRRIGHWGPIIAILIITTVTLSSTYSALQMWSLPVSVVPYMRGVHFCLMYTWLIPIFYNFFMAMKRGPGYVPQGWKPVSF